MRRIAHAYEKNFWRNCAIFSRSDLHTHCKREEFSLARNNFMRQKNFSAKFLGECKNLLRIFLTHFIAHKKARG
jgi:hypothetical protein